MNTEREKFENWYLEHAVDKSLIYRLGDYYLNYAVQIAWLSWQAAKADATPEWIPTSERMPEEGQEVLVHHLGKVQQATKDKEYYGGFKSRNCYGWESVSGFISHWMPKSIALPSDYNFYYENDAKATIEAQEQ